MSDKDYDPYWCVIRGDNRQSGTGNNNNATTNDNAYNPYWNATRPSHNNVAAARAQAAAQPTLHDRTFGARAHHYNAHINNNMGVAQRRNSTDMDIVTDNGSSHVRFGPPQRTGSSMSENKRIPFSSGHTLEKSIASGDITMTSEEFERLRVIESGGALYSGDDDYNAWPETYEDHHQPPPQPEPKKPRALEPVRSRNIAAATATRSAMMGPALTDGKPHSIEPKDMQVSPLNSPESYGGQALGMTTDIKQLMRSIARPPLEGGDVIEVGELEDPPTPGIIQPWMAVIGDKSARMPPRLTAGTMTLREVKTWYQDNRENYSSSADLYRDAMEYYFNLMKQRFGRHFPSDRLAQEATILVYCGSPEKPIRMERVEIPHCYKHRADMRKANSNKYGVAKLPIATQQFLTSKDGPPPLDQQLLDYCTRVDKRDDLPDREKKTFILYLSFTKALLDQANAGCPIAKSGLKKTNLNTSLRDLWKELSGI